MAVVDQNGLPVAPACGIEPASRHESRLVESTLATSVLDELPECLIGDRAYDSDGLDRKLAEGYAIEMIASHRRNRRRIRDNRPRRRCLRRWKVERLFAWLGIYRRRITRWEFHAHNFLGMIWLASAMLLLRHL